MLRETTFSTLLGVTLIAALTFDLMWLQQALFLLLVVEALTPIRPSGVLRGEGALWRDGHRPLFRRLRSAERGWRLTMSLCMLLSWLFPNGAFSYLPWFVGFATIGAGASGICPMFAVFQRMEVDLDGCDLGCPAARELDAGVRWSIHLKVAGIVFWSQMVFGVVAAALLLNTSERPDVSGPIDARERLLLIIGFLTLMWGLVLQRVMERVLTQPFSRMVQTARAFVSGGHQARFEESRDDEFGYLGRFINEALDQLDARQAALSHQARHDALTGLPNRREFRRQVQRLLEEGRREGVTHVVCYADLDEFKQVNDTCGHAGGDALLRDICDLLKAHVRDTDVVARLGGDEFALVFRRCSLEQAVPIADDLRARIEAYRYLHEGQPFQVGLSVGLAATRPADTLEDVLCAADRACYAAKRAGRNRVHVNHRTDCATDDPAPSPAALEPTPSQLPEPALRSA